MVRNGAMSRKMVGHHLPLFRTFAPCLKLKIPVVVVTTCHSRSFLLGTKSEQNLKFDTNALFHVLSEDWNSFARSWSGSDTWDRRSQLRRRRRRRRIFVGARSSERRRRKTAAGLEILVRDVLSLRAWERERMCLLRARDRESERKKFLTHLPSNVITNRGRISFLAFLIFLARNVRPTFLAGKSDIRQILAFQQLPLIMRRINFQFPNQCYSRLSVFG